LLKSQAWKLLDYAHGLYPNEYAVDVPPESFEGLDKLQGGLEESMALCVNWCGGGDTCGRYLELELDIDPFNLSFNELPQDV
jgi:hypothetical protein